MSLRLKKLKHSIKVKRKTFSKISVGFWLLILLVLMLLLLLSLSLQFSCSFNSKCVIIFMLLFLLYFLFLFLLMLKLPTINTAVKWGVNFFSFFFFSSVLVPCGFQDTTNIFRQGFPFLVQFSSHLLLYIERNNSQKIQNIFFPRLQKSLMCIFPLYIFKLLHTSYTFAAVLY